jgi:hypothetical protein
MPTQWSDPTFLDMLRSHGDYHADASVAQMKGADDFAALFRRAATNSAVMPIGAPAALQEFFRAADRDILLENDRARFPDGLDHDRLRRGELVFLDHAFAFCLVLLAKSLPEGYAAPCLSVLLNMSGNLRRAPYRRLMGVLQLVVDVGSTNGFDKGGRAIAAAKQARLMHAGIRTLANRQLPGYAAQYGGVPVNLEDMLGTIMGLSILVIDGVPTLFAALPAPDAEDYYYLWRAFAVAMGIHPPGAVRTGEWVPANLAEAREFYASYEQRHYEHDPALNPDGEALARENLAMINALVPRLLRDVGLANAPLMFVTELIGAEGCRRVGIAPANTGAFRYRAVRLFMKSVARFVALLDRIDPHGRLHPTLSRLVLQDMISRQYGGIVTFRIPESLKQVEALVNPAADSGT